MDFHVVLDAFRRNIHLFPQLQWVCLGPTGRFYWQLLSWRQWQDRRRNHHRKRHETVEFNQQKWMLELIESAKHGKRPHLSTYGVSCCLYIFLCLWPEAVIEKWRPQKDAVYRSLTTPKDGATRIVMDKQGTLAFINITCGHLCLDISYINLQERINQPQIRVNQRISVHIFSF